MRPATLLILTLLSYSSLALICNNTRMEFFSHFSLGRQDELNRTFTAIGKNLTIPNITYVATPTATYSIGNYSVHWRYIDNNQKANVTGQDTVIVWGGHLRVDVNFNWTRNGSVSKNGSGFASASSDIIEFAKNIIIDNKTGFVQWNLVHHLGVNWPQSAFVIGRINPYDEQDFQVIKKLMNHMVNASGFKDYLQEGINTLIDFYLNQSLHEEHFKQERFVNYTYNHPSKGNFTVEYDIVVESALIHGDGLHIFSSQVIKNFNDQECGAPVPLEPKDPKLYGGLQTFISFGLVKNTAKWGLANGVFDTTLNQHEWQSRHFQFYAGDLYDVIPAIQKKYYPDAAMNGVCKALQSGFTIGRGSQDTFNVTINYNCSLSINSTRIIDFTVESDLQIRPIAYPNHLDFVVSHANFNATYNQVGEYAVANKELADYYLNSTSWAIRGFKAFGSGFSMIARDYPHVQVSKDQYIFVYDSSHIGSGGKVLKTE